MLGTTEVSHRTLIIALDTFREEIEKDQPDPAKVREFSVILAGLLSEARRYAEQQQSTRARAHLIQAGCSLKSEPEQTIFGRV
jgi:hypothetical protein